MSYAEPSGMEEKKDLFPWRVPQEIMRPYLNLLDLSMGLLSTSGEASSTPE